MGRELQKKKSRSSVSKAVRPTRSTRHLVKSGIVGANWNQNQTLSQNYRRLGLLSRLNNVSGGVQKNATHRISKAASKDDVALAISNKAGSNSAAENHHRPTEVKVRRDPKSGHILQVLDMEQSGTLKNNPLDDPLNDLEESDAEELNPFASIPDRTASQSDFLMTLEETAAQGKRKAERSQSKQERIWIEQLVAKHKSDYGAMFRDRKLNPMQQSEGDIRRRVQRYHATESRV